MESQSPFEEMRDEHIALWDDIQGLQASIRKLAQPGATTSGMIRDAVEVFQQRLRIHFRREEEGLFPDAQRMVSEGAKGADVFGRFFGEEAEDDMSAHATLARRANEMFELATQMAEEGGPEEASARRLLALVDLTAGLLQRHAAKEDTLIFPMIAKSLTPDQIDAVSERLKALTPGRELVAPAEEEDESGLKQLG